MQPTRCKEPERRNLGVGHTSQEADERRWPELRGVRHSCSHRHCSVLVPVCILFQAHTRTAADPCIVHILRDVDGRTGFAIEHFQNLFGALPANEAGSSLIKSALYQSDSNGCIARKDIGWIVRILLRYVVHNEAKRLADERERRARVIAYPGQQT